MSGVLRPFDGVHREPEEHQEPATNHFHGERFTEEHEGRDDPPEGGRRGYQARPTGTDMPHRSVEQGQREPEGERPARDYPFAGDNSLYLRLRLSV
jgi:hypothetical protein